MKYVITGDTPSKKNSKIISCRGRFPIVLSSKNYTQWHGQASKQLQGATKWSGEVSSITLTIFPRTKRKSDLTNKAESLMDLLVDCNIIEDDNWFICPKVEIEFGGVDKVNPRAEIIIS